MEKLRAAIPAAPPTPVSTTGVARLILLSTLSPMLVAALTSSQMLTVSVLEGGLRMNSLECPTPTFLILRLIGHIYPRSHSQCSAYTSQGRHLSSVAALKVTLIIISYSGMPNGLRGDCSWRYDKWPRNCQVQCFVPTLPPAP